MSEEIIPITGRGNVHVIRGHPEPGLLKGQHILLDGNKVLVVGVEYRWAHKESQAFGVLVREEKQDGQDGAH